MTEDEFRNLWEPACNHLFGSRIGDHDHIPYGKLDKFLGVREFETYTKCTYEEDKPMSAALRRRVTLLAGPHWRTVLKANNITIYPTRKLHET